MRYIILLAAALAAPAAAQSVGPANPNAPVIKPVAGPGEMSREAPVNGVLTIYGNQRCPTDKSGNEVVVCVRRSAAEQFRVPKELRNFKVTPQNESWAKQQGVALATGQSGIGSCSTIGPGGGIGCFAQQARATKAENKERKADEHPDLSHF